MTENELTQIAIDISVRIHSKYGPGIFESVYESIFCHEWLKTGIELKRQVGVRVFHEGLDMGIGFIPDLILGNKVIVELKSVEAIAPVHYKQILTYLKLANLKVGLLINFNVTLMKQGIRRIVNNF